MVGADLAGALWRPGTAGLRGAGQRCGSESVRSESEGRDRAHLSGAALSGDGPGGRRSDGTAAAVLSAAGAIHAAASTDTCHGLSNSSRGPVDWFCASPHTTVSGAAGG